MFRLLPFRSSAAESETFPVPRAEELPTCTVPLLMVVAGAPTEPV